MDQNADMLLNDITPLRFPNKTYIKNGVRLGDLGDFRGYATEETPNGDRISWVGWEIQLGLIIPPPATPDKLEFNKFIQEEGLPSIVHPDWKKNRCAPVDYVVVTEQLTWYRSNVARKIGLIPKKEFNTFFTNAQTRKWLDCDPKGRETPAKVCKLLCEQKYAGDQPPLSLILRDKVMFNFLSPTLRERSLKLQKFVELTVQGLFSTRDHAPLDRHALIQKQQAAGGGAAAAAAAKAAKRAKPPKPPPSTAAARAIQRQKAVDPTGRKSQMVTPKQLSSLGSSVNPSTFLVQYIAQYIGDPNFRFFMRDRQLFIDVLKDVLDRISTDGRGKQRHKQYQTVILQELIPMRIEELEQGKAFADLRPQVARTLNAQTLEIKKMGDAYSYENALWDVLDRMGPLRKSSLQDLACGRGGMMWQEAMCIHYQPLVLALERIKEYATRPVREPPAPADLVQRVLANLQPPKVELVSLDGEGTNEVTFFQWTVPLMVELQFWNYTPESIMQIIYTYFHLKTSLPVEYACFVNLNLVLACFNADNNEDYLKKAAEAYTLGEGSPDFRGSPMFPPFDTWRTSVSLEKELTKPDKELEPVTKSQAVRDARKQVRNEKRREKEASSEGAAKAPNKPIVELLCKEAVRKRTRVSTLQMSWEANAPGMRRNWMKGTTRVRKEWVVMERTPAYKIGDDVVLENPPEAPEEPPIAKKRRVTKPPPSKAPAKAPAKKRKARRRAADKWKDESEVESEDGPSEIAAMTAPRGAGKRQVKRRNLDDD